MEWIESLPRALLIVAAAVLYARGVTGVRRAKVSLETARIASFVAGLAVLACALLPPLDTQADRVLWMHMVQHLLVLLVAPPLLLLGRPGLVWLMALSLNGRRNVAAFRTPFVRRAIRIASLPVAAWVLHVTVMWVWHVPSLYDAAARTQWIHLVEHASFLGTSLLFWHVLIGRRSLAVRSPAGAFFYVFFAAVQATALGALLTFASSPLYSFYASRPQPDRSPLEDQQLAGLIMWIPGGVVYVVAAAALFLSWFRRLERRQAATSSPRAIVPPLLVIAAFVSLGIVAPSATTKAQTTSEEAPPPDVYLADCAYCHGVDGEGTERGPVLTGVGAASADFMLRTGRMPIDDPGDYPKRAEPAYEDAEISEMVEYVASLGAGPEIPTVDVTDGDMVEGHQLYIDNCAACHATTGIGGALTAEAIAPSLRHSTPTEIAEAVRVGGNGKKGSMPVFGPETISDPAMNSLVRYVVYLQEPEDRGGAGLGHLGPIAEGFVGWVVGLGLLILVILWIGERGEEG
jgi:ubiquinol-cytochrome c reductase cytochrome c subunit